MSEVCLVHGGAGALLERTFMTTSFTALKVRLMTVMNDLDITDIATTHTEAAGGGYTGAATIDFSTTPPVTSMVNSIDVIIFATVEWVFTGPLSPNPDIVGYQVLSTSNELLWEEKFTTVKTPYDNGDTIKITPRLKLGNGTIITVI
jgi:hypothetical protein